MIKLVIGILIGVMGLGYLINSKKVTTEDTAMVQVKIIEQSDVVVEKAKEYSNSVVEMFKPTYK